MLATPTTDMFATATAVWLGVLVAFELAALVRVLILRQPLALVMPIFASPAPKGAAAAHTASETHLAALLAALLAAVRLAQLAALHDARQWTLTAAVHVLEAAYFTFEFLLNQPRRADGRRPPYPTPEAAVIYGIIMMNAGWFVAARVLLGKA
jgi:hypothetical protein